MTEKKVSEKWIKQFVTGCIRKKPYRTLAHAQNVANQRFKKTGVVFHCYYCNICGCYHLTRRKPGKWRRGVF